MRVDVHQRPPEYCGKRAVKGACKGSLKSSKSAVEIIFLFVTAAADTSVEFSSVQRPLGKGKHQNCSCDESLNRRASSTIGEFRGKKDFRRTEKSKPFFRRRIACRLDAKSINAHVSRIAIVATGAAVCRVGHCVHAHSHATFLPTRAWGIARRHDACAVHARLPWVAGHLTGPAVGGRCCHVSTSRGATQEGRRAGRVPVAGASAGYACIAVGIALQTAITAVGRVIRDVRACTVTALRWICTIVVGRARCRYIGSFLGVDCFDLVLLLGVLATVDAKTQIACADET